MLYNTTYFIFILYIFLVCTPIGFLRLFVVVGQVLVKPHYLRDVKEEYFAYNIEEDSVKRKLAKYQNGIESIFSNGHLNTSQETDTSAASGFLNGSLMNHTTTLNSSSFNEDDFYQSSLQLNGQYTSVVVLVSPQLSTATTEYQLYQRKPLSNDLSHNNESKLNSRLEELRAGRKELEKVIEASAIQRNIIYPVAMLLLLLFTSLTILLVVQNTLELLIGIKALPLSTRVSITIILY